MVDIAADGGRTIERQLSLYGKNLFDNRTIIQEPEINSVFTGYTVRPLTVGVSAKMYFE